MPPPNGAAADRCPPKPRNDRRIARAERPSRRRHGCAHSRARRQVLQVTSTLNTAPFNRLCEAVAAGEKGRRYALFGSTTAVMKDRRGRALGARHVRPHRTFRDGARPHRLSPGRKDPLPPIRPEVNWDVKARLEDMDRAHIDINALFPTHIKLLRPTRCRLRERAPRLPLGRRFLQAGACAAEMDPRRQYA